MEKKDAELAIKISVDTTELNEAIEKIKELTALCENSQQALDCMVQHIGTFLNQAAERKTANYGEPCEKCKYIKACKADWLSTMHPLLKESSVKFRVVHLETKDADDIKQTIEEISKARDQCRQAGMLAVAALIISGVALIIQLL